MVVVLITHLPYSALSRPAISSGDHWHSSSLCFTCSKRLVFWNHGGGSVGGVCLDERTGNSLSLNDITNAFTKVYGSSESNSPFEMIGFDACMMASYDTANAWKGITRYMTASEESESGNGWDYTRWVGALANNPYMSGAELGRVICDSYMKGCREYGTADTATLSVIDISKIPALGRAYENYGIEALKLASNNSGDFSRNLAAVPRKRKIMAAITRNRVIRIWWI